MAEPDEPAIKEALSHFHARLRLVFERGWAEWRQIEEFRLSKGWGPMLYPRTSANLMFDAIARAAQAEFGGDPRCRVLQEAQTIKVCFDERVVGRFKKGDSDGLGRNIPTQSALDFTDPQQPLPGLPPEADKVEFTWAANDIGTNLDTVLVVARNGEKAIWAYEIVGDEGVAVVDLPLGPPDPSQGTAGDELVAPKPKPVEGAGEDH